MKKFFVVCFCMGLLLAVGCTKTEQNLNYSLDEIVSKVYAGLENDLPNLANMPIDGDNLSYYLGIDSLEYKEAIASEPLMSSIAHSVVVIRMNDGADIEKAKKEIMDNVNPAKWICVEAESVIVESKGNVIILIMTSNERAEKIKKNFEDL